MRSICLSAVLAAALAAGIVAAQEKKTPPSPQDSSIFGETIDVRVVNVEAVVTDGSGNRVSGLKPGDFRLKVDGKEVPVTYFSEIAGGQSVAPPPAAEGSPAVAAATAVEPGGAVGTSYLVFIDDFFAMEIRRNEVLKALKGDLARLGPEDRMAIVAYDGGRLTMVSNWSQSQNQLERAFDEAMARPARGLDRVVEFQRFEHDSEFADGTAGDNAPLDLNSRMGSFGLTMTERAYGDTLLHQEEAVINAAARTLRTFASPPGRKVLLLLDGGWPYSIQSYIRGGGSVPATREFQDGDKLLRKLTSTANLLGYTIYPADVPGVNASADSFRDQEIKGTLEFVAKETGGKALRNSNRLAALTEAVADTRSYYWLGFSPTWERNDASHKVEVTVGKPGLKVRSRTDFLDLSKKTEVSMMAESALLFGNLPGGLPLPMRIGTMVRTRAGVEIPVTLGLPSDVVTLVPVGNKYARPTPSSASRPRMTLATTR